MNILLAILTFVLLIVTNVSSQDISGNWQGILYQQNGPYTTYFSSSFHFYQSGERINGSSLSILPNTNSYVTHNLLGSVNNNEFTFGTHIVSQVPLANGSWCSPNVTLTYDSISETLKGNWSDASCATGAIELSRLKTI